MVQEERGCKLNGIGDLFLAMYPLGFFLRL